MPKLGSKGAYHTVNGDALAFVIGVDADNPLNADDDLEVIVFAGQQVAGGGTGLEHGPNLRFTHLDDKAGGFTPFGK